MDFGGLPEVLKQCFISTILVFVNQLVGLLLSSSCFTGTSIRPNLLNIKRNEVIEEQMKQSASLIWSKYNPMQINSPIQLALQILRPYPIRWIDETNYGTFVNDEDVNLYYIVEVLFLWYCWFNSSHSRSKVSGWQFKPSR